jgi:hypothetical protein
MVRATSSRCHGGWAGELSMRDLRSVFCESGWRMRRLCANAEGIERAPVVSRLGAVLSSRLSLLVFWMGRYRALRSQVPVLTAFLTMSGVIVLATSGKKSVTVCSRGSGVPDPSVRETFSDPPHSLSLGPVGHGPLSPGRPGKRRNILQTSSPPQ